MTITLIRARKLPDNRVGITLHFLLHGIHHYLPMDKYRLVMPPTLFVVLAAPFWKLAHTLFFYNWYAAVAVYCGGVFGYICYDLTHYFLHHRRSVTFVDHPREFLANIITVFPRTTKPSRNTISHTTLPIMRTALALQAGSGTEYSERSWRCHLLRFSRQPENLDIGILSYRNGLIGRS